MSEESRPEIGSTTDAGTATVVFLVAVVAGVTAIVVRRKSTARKATTPPGPADVEPGSTAT